MTWTNIRVDAEAAKYQRTATVERTAAAEVRAMLGIFLFSGSQQDMWNPQFWGTCEPCCYV